MSVDAVLIAGPTASGKSAAAIALAERLNGAIVNTDSMQVYAELRVLTARPSAADEARVPHLLYGHVPVREHYSAGRYQEDARAALTRAHAMGRMPIFVGGTGLYFGVLTHGIAPIPGVPAETRASVRARFERVGREVFFAELARRDPAAAAALRPGNTQRILRAMEVLEATGRPLSAWHAAKGRPVLDGSRLARFALAPPRAELAARIDARFAKMVEAGALDEVRALVGLDTSLPAAKALGVPQLLAHLRGEMPLDAAIARVRRDTRRYAKRQMTWFRQRMADWTCVEDIEPSKIIAKTLGHLFETS